MLSYAVVVFAVAALGGIFLAAKHFKNQALPIPVVVVHGLAAATGLVLTILFVLGTADPGLASIGLVILFIAALGGFYLVSFTLRDKPLPSPVVIIHAVAAVVGFGLLVTTLLG